MDTIKVVVYMLNPVYMVNMYTSKNKKELTTKLFNEGGYDIVWKFVTDAIDPEKICEEVLDLANNPSRQDEREYLYGTGKSLSVGDIVEVGDDAYLCDSTGWTKV